MHLNCPHCQNPIEVVESDDVREVSCPSCSSSFGLSPTGTLVKTAPARRYQSASDLSTEPRRWLAGEPIHARPISAPERLWRWSKRNPRVAVLSAAVLMLLITIAIGSTTAMFVIAKKQRAAADQRDLSISYSKLGDVRLQAGQVTEALGHYQKALAISQKLAAADPTDAQAQNDLSISLERLGGVSLQLGQLTVVGPNAYSRRRSRRAVPKGRLRRRRFTTQPRVASPRAHPG